MLRMLNKIRLMIVRIGRDWESKQSEAETGDKKSNDKKTIVKPIDCRDFS